MTTTRAFPSLPEVSRDPEAQFRFLQAVREAVEIGQRRRGRVEDSFVRVQELITAGLIDPNSLQFFVDMPAKKPDNVVSDDLGGSGTVDEQAIIDSVTSNVLNSAIFADLNAEVDLRIRSFYQPNAPTATAVGDLWIDTDDFNKVYRWNGTTWQLATDSRIASMITDIANNTAAISTETTARIAGDTAISSSITTLTADVNNVQAGLATETTARVNGDNALSTSVTALQTTTGNLSASLTSEISARTSADTAIANDLALLGARNGAGTAWNLAMNTVYVDPTTTIATRFSSIDTRIGNAEASITTEQTARVNGDSSLASSITSLTSTVNGNTASINTIQSVQNGLVTQYMVKTNVNGHIAGFGLYNTGITSDFIIQADKFAIVSNSGGTPRVPFVIGTVNGVSTVGINGNLIVDGTVTATNLSPASATNNAIAAPGGSTSLSSAFPTFEPFGTTTITTIAGTTVVIFIQFDYSTGAYFSTKGMSVCTLIDGVQWDLQGVTVYPNTTNARFASMTLVGALPAGTKTISIGVAQQDTLMFLSVSQPKIFALELRR